MDLKKNQSNRKRLSHTIRANERDTRPKTNIMLTGKIDSYGQTYDWNFYIAERKRNDCWLIFDSQYAIKKAGLQILKEPGDVLNSKVKAKSILYRVDVIIFLYWKADHLITYYCQPCQNDITIFEYLKQRNWKEMIVK